MKNKLFEVVDMPNVEEMKDLGLPTHFNSRYGHRNVRAEWTGEKRPPKKGEWYISGAIPQAYRAPNDLSFDYYIARLVRVRVKTIVERY